MRNFFYLIAIYFGLVESTVVDETTWAETPFVFRDARDSIPDRIHDGLLTVAECAMNGLGAIINYADYFRICYLTPAKASITEEPYMILEWLFSPTFDDRVGAEHQREGVTEAFTITSDVDDEKRINIFISEKASQAGSPLRRIIRNDATMGSRWLGYVDEEREVGPYSDYVSIAELRRGDNPRVTRQIIHDLERPGIVGAVQGRRYAEDCMEITLAYALGFNPQMGYSQGMVDWCFLLKSVGELDNAQTFRLLIHMNEDIAKLFNRNSPHTESFTRSHALVQMYSQIYSWIKPEFGDILVLLDKQAIEDGQLPWELPANILEQHTLSMGTRGATVEETVPIMNYVLVHGRAGLMALFFAKLELNYLNVMTVLGTESGSHRATQLLNAHIPIGFMAGDLIEKADEYLESFVGLVQFDQTIEILDFLVQRHAKE